MITLHNTFWIWLVLGFTPYHIRSRRLAGGIRTVEIRALFWRLTLRLRPSGKHDWHLEIPLIERLRDAIWAAILKLRG